MANIVIDPRKLKTYEWVMYMCDTFNKDEAYRTVLWDGIVANNDLFVEVMHFIDNHAILDKMRCHGYTLTDLYVFMLYNDNLFNDTGKNTLDCNKDELVLDTFKCMVDLNNDPEKMIRLMDEGRGMDKL